MQTPCKRKQQQNEIKSEPEKKQGKEAAEMLPEESHATASLISKTFAIPALVTGKTVNITTTIKSDLCNQVTLLKNQSHHGSKHAALKMKLHVLNGFWRE